MMAGHARALAIVLLAGCPADPTGGHADGGHKEPHGDEHGDEHDEHPNEVHLDAHVIERNGITTEAAEERLLLGALEVPAEVQVNPDRTAHVTAPVPAQIVDVRASLGDSVKQGQILADLRSVDLGQARGDVAAAAARKKAADAELRRLDRLIKEGLVAKKAKIEAQSRASVAKAELSAARASLAVYGVKGGTASELHLTSPIAGTVIERHASPGEIIDRQTSRFVVADLSQVWMMGRVYEQEVAQVATGIQAEVALIAYPGKTWKGVVDYVSPTLDKHTRTVTIRVVLDNPDGSLRPGMFGTIAVGQKRGDKDATRVLSVPDAAVSSLGDRTIVFVEGDEPGTYLPRDVVFGVRAHGLVEIRTGLAAGEKVVTSGAFILKSELLKGSLGEGHAH